MTCCSAHSRWPTLSRRRMLSTVALGAGVSLLSTLKPGVARAAGHTEALLLTCMDYRLNHEIDAYMEARGLEHKYDHMVLAGASLGALNSRFPAWADVFWAHLDLAVQLHEVHRLICIDHRDCGAYKMILGDHAVRDPQAEFETHVKQLYTLRQTVTARQPHMEVELGLMGLDGKVTQIV